MDNFVIRDVSGFLEELKLDQLRTVHSIDLTPRLWLEIYVIYISLLCMWYLYKVKIDDPLMRRNFLLGFFTSILCAGLSTIHVSNTQTVIFSKRYNPARVFRAFHHIMSLTATVGIVGFTSVKCK